MPNNSESWFIKLGVLFDGTGFKKFGIAAFDVKKTALGLYDSFKKISTTGADLYRSSRYLNISSDRLQLWQRVYGEIGGSAEEASAAIDNLNFAFDKLRLGQGGELATVAARLRLRPEDLTSFETAMEALNRSYNTYFKDNYGQFRELAKQMGLGQKSIELVTQSTNEYQRSIQRAGMIPLISNRHLKAFDSLEKRFFLFSERFKMFKFQAASTLAPSIDRVLGSIEKMFNNPDIQKNLQIMFDSFEKMFNQMSRTENIEAFIKVIEAAVNVLNALVGVLAKVPDAMGWVGDKLGTLVGTAETFMDRHTNEVMSRVNNDPLTKVGVFNPFASIRMPSLVPDLTKFSTNQQQGNIVLNQTNNISGADSEEIADDVANKTKSALDPYREKRNIMNRFKIIPF